MQRRPVRTVHTALSTVKVQVLSCPTERGSLQRVVAVPVLDDSMVHEDDPKKSLYPRDEVVVDLKGSPKPGSVVLVYDREAQEHVLRRIEYPTRGTARLVAYNPAFPSFELAANSDHILGVVVALQRELS